MRSCNPTGPHCGGRRRASAGGHGRLRVLVDANEARVVAADLLGGRLPLEVTGEELLERVAPDAAADREADEPLDRRRLAEPVVHLVVVRAPAQQDADNPVTAPDPGLL